jgi:hypothetical protein
MPPSVDRRFPEVGPPDGWQPQAGILYVLVFEWQGLRTLTLLPERKACGT